MVNAELSFKEMILKPEDPSFMHTGDIQNVSVAKYYIIIWAGKGARVSGHSWV